LVLAFVHIRLAAANGVYGQVHPDTVAIMVILFMLPHKGFLNLPKNLKTTSKFYMPEG